MRWRILKLALNTESDCRSYQKRERIIFFFLENLQFSWIEDLRGIFAGESETGSCTFVEYGRRSQRLIRYSYVSTYLGM